MSSHSIPDPRNVARLRTRHIQQMKETGHKITAMTSYDAISAHIFDEAGVDLLLVGDSVANTILGHDSTLTVDVATMSIFGRAVAGAAQRALVVVDLPFGSYEVSPHQAVTTAIQVMKDTGAAAVKLEGGVERATTIAAIVAAGIPVVAHIGFTPQSEHALGGYRIQGRGSGAAQLRADAQAVAAAGAFAVVLEMVPAPLAAEVTAELTIPTIGIGAGKDTDGQILVWTDAFGFHQGRKPRFVREFAQLGAELSQAAAHYVAAVQGGNFPNAQESFDVE